MLISYEDGRRPTLDSDMCIALQHFFMLGLNPGSFGIALLLGDYDLAFKCAHVHLRNYKGEDIVQNMLDYVKDDIPEMCRGSHQKIDAWEAHRGLLNADAETQVYFKLKHGIEARTYNPYNLGDRG